jgi:hypothetical protein
MNPTLNSGHDGAAGLPTPTVALDGTLELRVLIPQNSAAAQGHGLPEIVYTVEASDNLVVWGPIATKSFGSAWTSTVPVVVGAASNGLVPVTVRDVAITPHRFLRLTSRWAQ